MKTVKLECSLTVMSRLLAGTWQALQQLCHSPGDEAIMPLPLTAVPMWGGSLVLLNAAAAPCSHVKT